MAYVIDWRTGEPVVNLDGIHELHPEIKKQAFFQLQDIVADIPTADDAWAIRYHADAVWAFNILAA